MLLKIDLDKCKDFVECKCLINEFDVIFFCLLDDVVKELVMLVDNLNICIIDVFIVYWINLDWVFGLLELVLD